MKQFLIRYRHQFAMLSMILVIGMLTLFLAGCGVPTWLSDAQNIVAIVSMSTAAIGSFIAGLTGNEALAAGLAVVSDWVTKVETGLNDLEALINQYNASPNPTILSDIESALADIKGNIQQDFSNLGLPASVLTVISGIAALALSQLEAWGSLIPATQAQAMTAFTVKTPYNKAEFKAEVNKIISTLTGDAEIDSALAKVKKA